MTDLGLGDLAKFPFIDPPDRRNVTDGVKLLEELGALDGRKLTPMGRQLAQLPVDPRLARMVIEADQQQCVAEVMVIAAALSIQDPRERPVDKQQQADEKHARFADKESDFFSYLNLWRYLREQQRELSGNQFRRLCRSEFLNYLRVREWQDIYAQLRQVARTLGLSVSEDREELAAGPQVHTALLAGLLSHIGLKDTDKREYLGARGAKFAIFPGSALFKKQPRWVMAAELVETSRLWGRVNARIEPEWAEQLAPHLVKRSYSEPHWEKKQGAVMAYEKVTLYGLPIVPRRKVGYAQGRPGAVAASCSSGTPWWRATGRPTTSSSPTTPSCWPGSRRSRTGPGAATSWSTTRPCTRSTTRGSRPRWCPPGTSTRGGRRPAAPTPTCSPSPASCWSTPAGTRSTRARTRTPGWPRASGCR